MSVTRRNVLLSLSTLLLGGCSIRNIMPNTPGILTSSLMKYRTANKASCIEIPKLVEAIAHARETLAAETVTDATVAIAMTPSDPNATIRVAHFSRAELDVLDKKLPVNAPRELRSVTNDATITWCGPLNGINTPFDVSFPARHVVLALKRTVRNDPDTKEIRTVVYTPYTRHIDNPLMRARGHEYLTSIIQKACGVLNERHVEARSFRGKSVTNVVPLSTVMCLAIIEHIDPSLMGNYTFEELANRVLVTIAANGNNAYTGAWSSAGAYGLLQFIKSTYRMIVKDYPEASLIPDFAEGMRDHVNGTAASMLLLDHDLSRLPYFKRWWIWWNPAALDEYLAAMYNSGKAARYMEKYGRRWSEMLPRETKAYLVKLNLMRSHLI